VSDQPPYEPPAPPPPPTPPPGGYGQPPAPPPPPPGGYGQAPPPPPPPPPAQPPGYGQPPPPGYGPPPGGGGQGPALNIGEALSYAWTKFTQNAGPLILVMLVVFVGLAVVSFVNLALRSTIHGVFGFIVISILTTALYLVVAGILQIGLWRSALAVTAGQPVELAKVFSTEELGPYIIATILFGLMVSIGLFLCVIPGIIVAFLGFFYAYFVLDQRQGPTDAIRSSFKLVSDNLGTLIPFAIVVYLVYLAGVILCFIGVLVTGPIALIATAYAYRKLNGQPVAA